MNDFLSDVLRGLTAPQKHLSPKYFYNAEGDRIFELIMHSDEYYPARCELEIFREQSDAMAGKLSQLAAGYDVIELGPGNALKSKYLLRALTARDDSFTYYPIDISEHVISLLQQELPLFVSNLKVSGIAGDYFEALQQLRENKNGKIVLFLGSTIGNMEEEDSAKFCAQLRSFLNVDDICIVGFDLRKDPNIIHAAYNDRGGLTREFNLNLLRRINEELDADFIIDNFLHYPVYDPVRGECKSYLVSKVKQDVHLANKEIISFEAFEPVYMEVSRKFTLKQIDELAEKSGFETIDHLFDSKGWFSDVIWKSV